MVRARFGAPRHLPPSVYSPRVKASGAAPATAHAPGISGESLLHAAERFLHGRREFAKKALACAPVTAAGGLGVPPAPEAAGHGLDIGFPRRAEADLEGAGLHLHHEGGDSRSPDGFHVVDHAVK